MAGNAKECFKLCSFRLEGCRNHVSKKSVVISLTGTLCPLPKYKQEGFRNKTLIPQCQERTSVPTTILSHTSVRDVYWTGTNWINGKKTGSIGRSVDSSMLHLLWENRYGGRTLQAMHSQTCVHVGFSVVHKGTIMTKNCLFLLFYGLLLGSLLKSHPWETTMCG